MRISARSLATTLLAVGVASCSDSPIAAVKQGPGPGRGGFAKIGFAPVFSKTAQYAAAHADEFGIEFDSVRVVIRDTPDTTHEVARTTIFFDASSGDSTLDLQVQTEVDGQRFDALIQYLSPTGEVVYSGHSIVQSYPVGGTPPDQTPITINFVGPGARAAKITVSPKTVSVIDGQTQPFTVAATDSSGAPIAAPPVAWSVSDPNVASISSAGLLTTTGHRATVTVTATTPTGLSDNAAATITLPAASIAVVSGAGQTGKVGTALANPAVVQVSASDGVGVAGVNVIFSAPSGGAVGVTSAVTDANGRASTTLRLGTVAGLQSFAATAGTFSVGIPITATAGDATAITAVSGGGQADTVLHALRQPLVVHVSDQFDNPVVGATVSWSRIGAGTLSAAASATNGEGNASVSYTLGSIAGSEHVTASVGGVNTPVSFAVSALAGAPAAILWVSQPAAGSTGISLSPAPQVRVVDAYNNLTGATNAVTLSLTGGANGAKLGGTLTQNTTDGTATFSDITINKAGAAYALVATLSSPALSATSAPFNIVSSPPTQLVLSPATPTSFSFVAGSTPTNSPVVKTLDAANNGVPGVGVRFVASAVVNGVSVVVKDTTIASDANGSVAVSALPLTRAGVFSLAITSSAIPNAALSLNLTVTPAAAAALVFTAAPSKVLAGAPITPPVTVQIQDQYGNAVPSDTRPITLAITAGTGATGALLSGTTQVTPVNGSATFSDLSIALAGTGYSLTATSSPALTPAASAAFDVQVSSVAQITTPNGSTIVNTQLATSVTYPSFKLLDANNKPVTNQNVTLEVSAPCSVNNSTTRTSDSNGLITFNSDYLYIPTANPASCILTASTQTPSGTTTAATYLIVAPTNGIAWTGSTSSDWASAANWSTNAVPTSATPVYVPLHALNSPTLGADQAVDSILVEDGAMVKLGGHTLTSYGTVDAGSSGIIQNGKLTVMGNGTGNNLIRGVLPTTTCAGSSQYQLSGSVYFVGSLTLNSCALTLNGYTALIDTNFTATGSSTLVMSNPNDVLYVTGNANFSGSSASRLSDGELVVLGSVMQLDSAADFNASGNNAVYLIGSSSQSISFAKPNSAHFNNLYITNSGSDSVHVTTPVTVNGTLYLGATAPLTLEDTNTVTAGSLQLGAGAKLAMNQRAQVIANSCTLYKDGINDASVVGTSLGVASLLGSLNVLGLCGTTPVSWSPPPPATAAASAIQRAAMTALRRPRSTARLR